MRSLLILAFCLISPLAWSADKNLVEVQVTSDPSGARVSMRSGQSCFTPCFLKLSRKRESLIIVSKRGFRTSEINFRPTRKQKKLHISLVAEASPELNLGNSGSQKGTVWPSNAFIDNFKLPQREANAHDVAVIVGNFLYQHEDIPDVSPARNDAQLMRRYVIQTLGINPENVIYRENATYGTLVALFGDASSSKSKLKSAITPGISRVFIYYSGHGASSGSSSFLVPVDGEPSFLESIGYPIDWLYLNLSKLEAIERTVVLESCFSGNSHAGTLIKNASPVQIRSRVTSVPDNVNAITATSKAQVASWDETSALSLFTKHFLLAQAGSADRFPNGNEDEKVSNKEVERYVGDRVRQDALRLYDRQQNPQFMFVSY